MCEAGDLFSAFTTFSSKVEKLRRMTESAELLEAEGAPAEVQSKAYDDIEEEFFRESAFDDASDTDEEEELRRTQDFNDSLVHTGN
jgi:deoxyribodipyrimidine photolyase